MFALLLYALKTGACLTLFYLFFKLLLSRETFHRLNRAAVLAMLALSCLLPLCVVTFTRELPAVETSLAFVTTDAPGEAAALVVAEPFPWREAAALLYLAGVFVALARMVRSLVGVWRMIRSGRRERLDDGTVLVRTTLPVAPFSWGRWIVLNETDLRENGETILCHERRTRGSAIRPTCSSATWSAACSGSTPRCGCCAPICGRSTSTRPTRRSSRAGPMRGLINCC